MLFAVDEAVLQHLGIAGEDVFAVHGPQELGVEDDAAGVVEDADFVFQSAEVDACLSAYAGIDHREQGGGYINIRYAALERRCCKAAQVGDHAAAEVDHQRVARGTHALQFGPYVAQRVQRLVGVGGTDDDGTGGFDTLKTADDGQAETLGGVVDKYE